MKTKYTYILIFLLFSVRIHAQVTDTLNREVSPKGGINSVAVKYYGIDFTREQRLLIQDKEIEFIFQVNEVGVPTLAKVNGIHDIAIIDSLKNITSKLEKFNPKIRNGIAEPSIYFMKLVYPTYKMTPHHFNGYNPFYFSRFKLKDFEFINKTNERIDFTIGGMVNQFIGTPEEYLATGGGMKVDFMYTDRKSFLYGFTMSAYGNRLKKEYPLLTNRKQFENPPTLLVGGIFGKWFNAFNIQAEINYVVQNITERMGKNDADWVQLKGWSPGIVMNYILKLGKEIPTNYYGSPMLFQNNLNFHFGLRHLFLSIPEASGLMVELGVSYRMTLFKVKDYKLKDEYLENIR